MIIYVSHSRDFEYKKELYFPLTDSPLLKTHRFILPHEKSDTLYHSKALFKEKKCDLVLAEVSYPSTGVGIELGWADIMEIPVVCIYRAGVSPSQSLKAVSHHFIAHINAIDLVRKLASFLNTFPVA